MEEALAETRRVLEEGSAPTLFKAAFAHQGLLCRVDVLERLPGGGWRLIEIKSAKRPNGDFVLETAFQHCVLRPYDAVPFLFSVHAERNGGEPAHVDYLHEQDDDPRPHLADRLIEAVGTEGSICNAHTFIEQFMLSSLARALPERADDPAAISARLVGLLSVVRGTYYHAEFRGSFSLENVLSVLVPGEGYDDVGDPDGREGSEYYMQALRSTDSRERQQSFENLRAYSKRVTLAIVRLRKALEALRP